MSEILSHFPTNLQGVIQKIDGVIQTHTDSLAVCTLAALSSLSAGASISVNGGKGRPLILYAAAFMQSGTGKSAAANAVRKYILNWREEEFKKEDAKRKAAATKEAPAKPVPDVFLEAASAEGLEVSLSIGSTPFIFLDELGLLIKMSKNDTVKQALLKAIMSVFDSGSFVTRRLKEERRASLVTVQGLGLFAASTLGQSNLSNEDLKDMISNGALNRFLVTFGGVKPIPLKDELTDKEAGELEAFAKKFAAVAEGKNYKFDEAAKKFYTDYHKKINLEYLEKIYQMDDGAGLVVRKLTFLQRLAGIFQICLDFEKPKNNTITLEAAKSAADLLEYLDTVHFSQIGLYARSKSGKLTTEQRILDKIAKKPGINYRTLCQSFTMLGIKAEQIKTSLDLLLKTQKITEQNSGYHKA
jgi:hypothetical protein